MVASTSSDSRGNDRASGVTLKLGPGPAYESALFFEGAAFNGTASRLRFFVFAMKPVDKREEKSDETLDNLLKRTNIWISRSKYLK